MLSEQTQHSLNDSEEQLEEYEQAKKALYNHFYLQDEIMEDLKKREGKHHEHHGAAEDSMETGMADHHVDGGAKLDKRVRRRQDLQKSLLKAFSERLNIIFDAILRAAQQLGERVGAGKLPLSTVLEKFPKALEMLPNIQQKYVYYALAGFYNDIRSREEREKFISSVKYLISVIDEILKDSKYTGEAHFKDMRRGFEEIVKLIDDFSSKFIEGFGPLPLFKQKHGGDGNVALSAEAEHEKHISSSSSPVPLAPAGTPGSPRLREQLKKPAYQIGSQLAHVGSVSLEHLSKKLEEKAKGAHDRDYHVKHGGEIPEISRAAYQLDRLKEIILYYFRTARIRVNLAHASKEMQVAGADYVKVLADAIASSVDKCTKERNFIRSQLEDEKSSLYQILIPDSKAADIKERKETLKLYGKMKESIYATKIEMYRIAEAVDLYMKAFADGISAHPDDMHNIMRILNSTEVISKWFTDKSGDMLCQVFDSFPASYNGQNATYNRLIDNKDLAPMATKHYYVRVAIMCQLGDIPTLRNQLPDLVRPVVPAGTDPTWTQVGQQISGYDMNQAPISGTSTDPSLPGIPFLGIDLRRQGLKEHVAEKVLEYASKALNVTMLKNIISVFVSVGSSFGGQDLAKKCHRSSIQIYKGLTDYMTQSAFALGLDCNIGNVEVLKFPNPSTVATKPGVEVVEVLINPQVPVRLSAQQLAVPTIDVVDVREAFAPLALGNIIDPQYTIYSSRFRMGITATPHLPKGGDYDIARLTKFAMRGVGEVGSLKPGSPPQGSPFASDYGETDMLFVMVIKSMVAKVLTTIGVYNMFNRPINRDGLGFFSGLRLILGGAAETPKIIPEALELYIRLPLLAEFYRKVFNFEQNDPSNTDFRVISMVPEMDGTFSGLISLIFDRARYVENGNYSETDIRSMIEEINKIWIRFHDSKDVISDIIQEFIAEINRRVGIYEREERERYIEERQKRYDSRYVSPEEITDFELNTIDEDDTHWRPSPSMSFQTEGGIAGSRTHKYKLDIATHSKYIDDVRRKIDNMFKHAEDDHKRDLTDLRDRFSFEYLLRARREEMKNAKTEKERFDIVHSAITSLGQFAMPAMEKSYIYFHEFVVAPLKTLDMMYVMLKNFYDELNKLYLGLRYIEQWAKTSGRTILGAGGLFGPATPGDRWDIISRVIGGTGVIGDPGMANTFIIMPGTQGLPVQIPGVGGAAPTIVPPVSYQDLNNMAIANANTPGVDQVLYRFVIDQGKVMYKAFELLFGHASTLDGLIESHLEVAHDNDDATCAIAIKIDHSKLRQYISNVFSGAKQSIDRCRGLIPAKIMERYEKYETKGSLYYLEKHLIDELLDGKWSSNVNFDLGIRNDNLDRANDKFQFIFAYLTHGWEFNARGLNNGVLPLDFNIKVPKIVELGPNGESKLAGGGFDYSTKKSFQEFDRELYTMIFYDPFDNLDLDFPTPAGNINRIYHYYDPAAVPPRGYLPDQAPGILKILFNRSGKIKDGIAPNMPWDSSPTHTMLLKALYDPKEGLHAAFDARRSLFVVFNRLIAAYLDQVYDGASDKIYIGAINEFAGGAFSSSVLGDDVYDDQNVWTTNDIMGDPSGRPGSRTRGVLLYTLGRILRQFLTEKTISGDKKQYLETDINEIPLYIKEQMRASMPIFSKLFRYLNLRCELTKVFVQALNVAQPVNDGAIPPVKTRRNRPPLAGGAPVLPNEFLLAKTNTQNENNMIKILDKISTGCLSLVKCIQDTLADLSDDPKYLETHHGFIQEYESSNGMLPFMPESSMLYYLRNTTFGLPRSGDRNTEDNDIAMPIYKLGSTAFKLQYGTRGILCHKEIKAADIPGMLQIVKWHNQSSDQKHHMDEKALDTFADSTVSLIRYLIDAKRYRGIFSLFVRGPAVAPVNLLSWNSALARNQAIYTHTTRDLIPMAAAVDISKNLVPYSLLEKVTLFDVLRMTESNFQAEQRRLIVVLVRGEDPCAGWMDRDKLIINNIIDLNVVPVDIHALRREIPLIHLYNYSWTFDRLIREMFGISEGTEHIYRDSMLTGTDLSGNAPGKKLMGCLMMHPYKGISTDVYNYYLPQIVRGDLGMEGLGRPKYLADEVFNKALFGELYPGTVYREEGGPGVGDGHLRGKEEVLSDLVKGGKFYRNMMINCAPLLLMQLCSADNFYRCLPSFVHIPPATAGNYWEANVTNHMETANRYRAMIRVITDKTIEELVTMRGDPKLLDLEQFTKIRIALRDLALDSGMADPFVFPHVLNHTNASRNARGAADMVATMAIIVVHTFLFINMKAMAADMASAIVKTHPGMSETDFQIGMANDWNKLAETGATIDKTPVGMVWMTIVNTFTGDTGLTTAPASYRSLGDLNFNNLAGRPPEHILGVVPAGDPVLRPASLGAISAPPSVNSAVLIGAGGLFQSIRDAYVSSYTGFGVDTFKNMDRYTTWAAEGNTRYFPNNLHYLETDEKTGETVIKEVSIGHYKEILQLIGKFRFDTVLVRNLFWLTNIQRMLRLKLRQDLTWFDQKVVSEHAALASGITELYGNDRQPADFPNTYRY
jgi:hypothetical protein